MVISFWIIITVIYYIIEIELIWYDVDLAIKRGVKDTSKPKNRGLESHESQNWSRKLSSFHKIDNADAYAYLLYVIHSTSSSEFTR